jgi:hypothetical protein
MINGTTLMGELVTVTAAERRGVSNFCFDLWMIEMLETQAK